MGYWVEPGQELVLVLGWLWLADLTPFQKTGEEHCLHLHGFEEVVHALLQLCVGV